MGNQLTRTVRERKWVIVPARNFLGARPEKRQGGSEKKPSPIGGGKIHGYLFGVYPPKSRRNQTRGGGEMETTGAFESTVVSKVS